MSTACRILVLSNALVKVSCCVPDTMCIARITWETVNNALSIYNWRLDFFGFKILPWFLAHKNRLQRRENLFAKIAQLLPNCISDYLIFERKTNSYCLTIIGVSFRCACRSISKKKVIDSGINKALRVARRLKMERNLTSFYIKSLCGRR